MSKILFHSWTYKRNIPEPFEKLKGEKRSDIASKYCNTKTKMSSLHGQTLAAVIKYIKVQLGTSIESAVGIQEDNFIISEYKSRRDEIHLNVFNKNNGKFICGVIDGKDFETKKYEYEASKQSGTALLFTLMPLALEDDEFKENYDILYDFFRKSLKNLEQNVIDAAYVLCDNLYRRIENTDSLGSAGIKVDDSLDNITLLSDANIEREIYSPNDVLCGTFTKMTVKAKKNARKTNVGNSDFANSYKFTEREFSLEEKEYIPILEDWYVRPHEVDTICKHAKETSSSITPMRNFLLRGPSGVGKTEMAKAVATGIGLPFTYFTCSANTEEYDLFEKAVFESETKVSEVKELPTLLDIQMDPPSAYFKMTDKYIDDVDEETVYKKLIETIENNALVKNKTKNKGEKQRIVYKETELTKAIKNGWLIEIQEPTVISNPAVLVALNALLDGCNTITLPHTGEIIKRHPDTVILMTTNNDYFGCRPMNQSILSRMNLIRDIAEPTIEDMVKRVSNITKFDDFDKLEKMATVVKNIDEFCKNQSITDGCCGMREFISWVQSYMIENDLIETAKYTVVSSASANLENQEEIIAACIEPNIAS